jgi:cytochrome c551/c552
MKKVILISLGIFSILSANEAEALFNSKCATCHKVQVTDKNSLIAPPINKVMMHIKKSFKDKDEALKFMKEYAINPDPTKTVCPSIDIFGVMPPQKGVVTDSQLDKIVNYLYDNFPKGAMQHRGMGMGRGMHKGMMGKMAFMKIDSNGDGAISKEEFNAFRAKKEGIDPSKIKYDYFFKRLDKNGDGKLDQEEFMGFIKMMRGE